MFTLDECPPYRRVKVNRQMNDREQTEGVRFNSYKGCCCCCFTWSSSLFTFYFSYFFHQWSWIRTQPMCTLTVPTCTHPLGNTKSPRKITPEVIWIPSTMPVQQSFILVDLFSHSCEEGTNSKLRVTKYIEDITWPRGDTKFVFECWKYFFNTRREISYL